MDRMAQVLNNLVANALRHTLEGEVVLGAAAHNGQVNLSVADSGTGIAPDDLPYVFDRFYRGDKARQRTDSSSSGLGLAIAKAVVEAHGGAIAVDSTLGRGTTFTLTFPTATHETSA
jgi:two-component system sensor histidine kinase BaeS